MSSKQIHMSFATQAIAILREIQPLTGHREWVFTSRPSPLRPMSENAVLAALRSLGIAKEERAVTALELWRERF
jgi:hypothetical protein